MYTLQQRVSEERESKRKPRRGVKEKKTIGPKGNRAETGAFDLCFYNKNIANNIVINVTISHFVIIVQPHLTLKETCGLFQTAIFPINVSVVAPLVVPTLLSPPRLSRNKNILQKLIQKVKLS